MERPDRPDKLPPAYEVGLPHRSDGVGYALRASFKPTHDKTSAFSELIVAIDQLQINPGRTG